MNSIRLYQIVILELLIFITYHQVRNKKKRKFIWIGHTLRKEDGEIPKAALFWNPQGRRKRGRPRNSWRR
jgi:hypothetical protein